GPQGPPSFFVREFRNAVFAQTGGVCGGGLYCEELRQECLAAGKSKVLCDLQYRHCVQDACGAR
ncbi:hypothetical protein, partial [Stenotrophomonas maltophilia]|uniref:hypothetical protein n=1 Tax=Stenotrophomonas maltophilia TaxID=40324 RepID=UPI001AA1C660